MLTGVAFRNIEEINLRKNEREHHLTFTIAPRMITVVAYLLGNMIRTFKSKKKH